MKCMYTITVGKGISAAGLVEWYRQRYEDSCVGTPVLNDENLWTVDIEVNREDCDHIESVMDGDARIRSYAAKE